MIKQYPSLSEQEDERRILNNINQYRSVRRIKCLMCGYDGLMGYIGASNPVSYTLQLIFGWIFFFISILFGPIGIVIGILVLIGSFASKKKKYYCPNCETEIVERK